MQSIVCNTLGIKAASVAGQALSTAQMEKIVIMILSRVSIAVEIEAIEEGVKTFLPLIGAAFAVPLSFAGTYLALNAVINKFEEVAIEVMQCV